MKTFAGTLLLGLALTWAAALARAQDLPGPLLEQFFPPDLVRMAQPALHLTDEQEATLQDALDRVEPHLAETRKLLEKANGTLSEMVKPEKLDNDAVMEQADRVLRLQTETQRATLALLLRIREILTPEQQAKLREFKSKTAAFQARIRQASELAAQWKAQGRDLSGFEQARRQFEALMGAGDFRAAETTLDNTLKRLKEPPAAPKSRP